LIAVVLAVGLSGCALLKKKPKEDVTYQEQPVEPLYSAGAQRLDRKQWSDSISYFKEVERQHPYSEWSRRAILMEAYAHYQANQYSDAVNDADRFIELYPGNPSAAYAYYLKAQCYFEQILDVNRDQAATQQSLSAMREVSRRYPHTEYAEDARLKIDMINDQLAGKEMTIGRWYLRQGDTLSAIGRFKGVVEKYQTTTHAPEALDRLVEAYLTLGLIEEAKRNAAVLGYNFPGDAWYADAYTLMTQKGLRPAVTPVSNSKKGFLPRPPILFHHNKAETLPPPSAETDATTAAETSPVDATEATATDATPAPKHHWFDFGGHKAKTAANTAAPAPAADSTADTATPDQTGDAAAPAKKKKHKMWTPWGHHKDAADSTATDTSQTQPAPAPAAGQ
jgi:outer membrane protein assembly factor BamD